MIRTDRSFEILYLVYVLSWDIEGVLGKSEEASGAHHLRWRMGCASDDFTKAGRPIYGMGSWFRFNEGRLFVVVRSVFWMDRNPWLSEVMRSQGEDI